jgi:glycosyltransferase involved in cell wall biosynthesis
VRLALVTDAWAPQVNGVVRTLETTVRILRQRGIEVLILSPDQFPGVPCPGYASIRLAVAPYRALARRITAFGPQAVHIATEGPLGWAARSWCLGRGFPFTTSFHTRFADYLAVRTRLPAGLFWPMLRRFHGPARAIFTATDTLALELATRGLPHTHRWSRGVDLSLFGAVEPEPYAGLPRPVLLHVGRLAAEKNIEAFLRAEVRGTKVVVGDGPLAAALRRGFPAAHFLGALHGAPLAAAYAGADCLVFPSRTDTFGMVMVEALASGVPVAGYPVPGPLDIVGAEGCGPGGRAGARIGAVDPDLGTAIARALGASRQAARAEAQRYDWDRCTDQFLAGLSPLSAAARAAA